LRVKNISGTSSFDFLCSAEWHLSRSGSMHAAVIYGFALKLSNSSGRFNVSIHKLADYFDADPRYIRKAIHKLVRAGFFVKLKEVPGSAVAYRPVPHAEWARKNPDSCLVKVAMPWENEKKDQLAVWLFAASDGTMKCFPNFMVGMRKLGHSDAAVREHFEAFYASDGPDKKGRYKRFMKYLRSQPVKPISVGASV
jgi:hypothetical protein